MIVERPLIPEVLLRGAEVHVRAEGLDADQLGEHVEPDGGEVTALLALPVPVVAGEVVADLN